jgi:lipopolysaccharide biosynthesis regulator YciM
MNEPAKIERIVERSGGADATMIATQSGSLVPVTRETQALLGRMFADPRTLEKHETVDLVAQLSAAVKKCPAVSELRVLLGMALCVNLQPQKAIEELAEAVSLAPDSFIAHLKMGELWMRLRVCDKAVDHTNYAAKLAENLAQAELARRQSATLRELMRNGIDRNGYRTPWLSLNRLKRLWSRNRGEAEALATVDAG